MPRDVNVDLTSFALGANVVGRDQVRPVTDERLLNRLAELSLDEVRPEFKAQVSLGGCFDRCIDRWILQLVSPLGAAV